MNATRVVLPGASEHGPYEPVQNSAAASFVQVQFVTVGVKREKRRKRKPSDFFRVILTKKNAIIFILPSRYSSDFVSNV